MRTLTVSLTPKQAERLKQAVETGDYASNSEVVRDALRLWEQREEVRAADLARLKQAYAEGIASGVADGDIDTLLAELQAERRAHG